MISQTPSISLLGVRIDLLTQSTLFETFTSLAAGATVGVATYANIQTVNIACQEIWFRNFLNEADCVWCDGHGVILGAKLLGKHIPEKITGAHWISHFAEYCAARGHSLFLLGSEPGVAEEAAKRLREAFPRLKISGTHHGYFDKSPFHHENLEVISRINQAQPDILFVGFGCPMQEKWIQDNHGKLRVGAAIAIGAAIDYVAGHISRPPRWLTDNGLEWLGRLWYEPRRLAARYFVGNPLFLARCVRERFRLLGKQES